MPWLDDAIQTGSSFCEARHLFSRKRREIPVRVMTVEDPDNGGFALVFGEIAAEHCLVRIHSRCLYGESLRSDDCDCGEELRKALDLIQRAGSGVLIYLEQEGRGAGLIVKARGYQHSERTGADTFTSYEALGYAADLRNYDAAAAKLAALGLRSVQLLTNNPEKAAAVRAAGVSVEVVSLYSRLRTDRGQRYHEAKRQRGHHLPVHPQRTPRWMSLRRKPRPNPARVFVIATTTGLVCGAGMWIGRAHARQSVHAL